MGCQEIIELEVIAGSHLVQPPTPEWVPGICLILADVHLSRSDANTMALPSSLYWCSVVPTVTKLLLDIAWIIPSIILAHSFTSYQTQARGRDYPLFAELLHTWRLLLSFFSNLFLKYFQFLQSFRHFRLCPLDTHLCSPLNDTFLQCLTWIQDSCGGLLTDVKGTGKLHTSCGQCFFLYTAQYVACFLQNSVILFPWS